MKIQQIRSQFPKLCSSKEIHLDGPGGTQVPQTVIDGICNYLVHSNANLGAPFRTSKESDELFIKARNVFQEFFNSQSNEGIIFGNNMTSLTMHFSRCMATLLKPNDKILVTNLDHEANISPWQLLAQDIGCTAEMVKIHPETCELNLFDLKEKIKAKPKIVAFTGASNAVGSINLIKEITELAHQNGALTYVDAVHLAPHRLLNVKDWNADFVICSAYKFFGPHLGIAYAKPEILNQLKPYKVRPASNENPYKWMTGTQNHEGIAGAINAVLYLASLGSTDQFQPLRSKLELAYNMIEKHEASLAQRFLEKIWANSSYKVLGYSEPTFKNNKVSTFSIQCLSKNPRSVAQELANRNIFAYSGNFYAKSLLETLGLDQAGGVLRIGFVHYNTLEEVDQTVEALSEISAR